MRYVSCLLAMLVFSLSANADFIIYTFNDEGQKYPFGGSFAVDTNRLTGSDPNAKLMTADSIVQSDFWYRPFDFTNQEAHLKITSLSSPAVVINPFTGAVLSDTFVRMGPSPILTHSFSTPDNVLSVRTYQILESSIEFNRRYNLVGYRNFDILGAQFASGVEERLSNTSHTIAPRLFSFGHWDVTVQPVPSPGGLLLLLTGMLCLAPRYFRRA